MSIKWIKNVKLEVGSYQDDEGYGHTETDLFHLKIVDGKISEQIKANEELPESQVEIVDAKGFLAVPTFKEMHNHLDKTYLSLDWKASAPTKSLKERLQREAEELTYLAPTTKQRATKMIETLLSYGSTHIRTHVNIDPYIGLQNLEGVLEALDAFKGKVTADIIAFPQHGLLRHGVPELMKEAMRSGATMIGGLDPAGIDRNIEKSLYLTMDLAQEFNADVDMHIHDAGHVGIYTINKWLDLSEEAGWKDRSAISHAFSIGQISDGEAQSLSERLAANGTSIMSTVPLTVTVPPILLLDKAGVDVHFGCDGFYDSWSPYGTGDVLEKVTLFCEMNGIRTEAGLRKALKFATNGITPLNAAGEKQWPLNGDRADILFVDATSTAELVARRSQREAVMVNGTIVSGNL